MKKNQSHVNDIVVEGRRAILTIKIGKMVFAPSANIILKLKTRNFEPLSQYHKQACVHNEQLRKILAVKSYGG